MNKIIKAIAYAFLLLATMFFVSCSSQQNEEPDINPDITFSGDINDVLLTRLANGEVMSGFSCKYVAIYSGPADNSADSEDKWQLIKTEDYESTTPEPNSIWRFNLGYMFIKNGQSLIYGDYVHIFHPRLPILYLLWWNYKWFSSQTYPLLGYKSDFIYNSAEKLLTLNGNTFRVECCDDKNLVLSYEETTDIDEYGNSIPMQRLKYIFVCSPLRSYIYEPVTVSYGLSFITMFESERELKLHMLKELREYYGDEIEQAELRGYTINQNIDLAKYEEDIRNGIPDDYFIFKYLI